MDVILSPDLEGKLARAAGRRGVSAELLIREALERAVDYDEWFIREVEKGLAEIDAGQVLTHDAVGPVWSSSWPNTSVPSMMELRWTQEAAADLERIADYHGAQQWP